ncbi:integral membrane protein [Streptomyces hygroscopicus subsp. jinggangensis 5008]|nr:integral membrane protein [Streptomyces hygroscopicus subsp. jinggangensis 5008]AGF64346.1 integral membrane protein [Streptomyces hygroscopicus subsp. jinggangensis TL01]
MTNQPYQEPYQGGPYEGYDPYQQQWPAQEPHHGQPGHDPELTQQWQGQTWETQTHAPVQAAETAYLPRQEQQQGGYQQAGYPQPGYQQPAYQEPRYQQPQPQQHYAEPYAEPYAGTYGGTPAGAGTYAPAPNPAPAPAPAPQPAAAASASPADAEAGPAYGPATLAGNARITDAQRARLEGRSPIIEPGMQPALLTAVLGLLLAAAAPVASYALAVPLVVLQAVTAAGWFRLNGMWPARQGIALAFAGALTSDVAVLAAGRDHALVAILGPLGLWVLLSLVLQLRSHASPDERMYGLMATVASAALAVLATGYLAVDPHAVSVGAAAVAVAVLARALPLPTPVSVVVALLAAAGAGIAVGGMTGFGTKGALLGAAAGVCALVGHRVASYDYPSRFVHFTAGVALPLSAAAPVVWVLGRALG